MATKGARLRVAITGATGNVGTSLIEALAEDPRGRLRGRELLSGAGARGR